MGVVLSTCVGDVVGFGGAMVSGGGIDCGGRIGCGGGIGCANGFDVLLTCVGSVRSLCGREFSSLCGREFSSLGDRRSSCPPVAQFPGSPSTIVRSVYHSVSLHRKA